MASAACHLRAVPDHPHVTAHLERQRRALPTHWDGHQVRWSVWGQAWSTAAWHAPVDQVACQTCGALDHRRTCTGVYWVDPGALLTAPGTRRLLATRCVHCGTDEVTELAPRTMAPCHTWVLDDSDYGPGGSWPEGQGTLL